MIDKKRIVSFVLAFVLLGNLSLPVIQEAQAAITNSSTLTGTQANGLTWKRYTASDSPPLDEVNGFKLTNYYYVTSFNDSGSSQSNGFWKTYIDRARTQGIIYGTTKGNANPTEEVKAKEAATMALRYCYTKAYDNEGKRVTRKGATSGDEYNNCLDLLDSYSTQRVTKQFGSFNLKRETYFPRCSAFVYVTIISWIKCGVQDKIKDIYSWELGYFADGSKIDNVHPSLWPYFNDGSDQQWINSGGTMPQATEAIIARCANYLMDKKVLEGANHGSGTTGLDFNRNCTRMEWFKLLTFMADPEPPERPKPGENNDNPPGGGGGNDEPDPSTLDAKLSMSGDTVRVNYYDFFNNGSEVSGSVSMNASSSKSNYKITDYAFNVKADGTSGKSSDSSSGTKSSKSFSFDYTMRSLGKGESLNYSSSVTGSVKVSDSFPKTDTDSDGTSINIKVTNELPTANFTAKTDCVADSTYAQQFFYVGEPITITDLSVDPENDWKQRYLAIMMNGPCIATLDNFEDYADAGNTHILTYKPISDTQASFTFHRAGTYQFELSVLDSLY